MARTRFPLVAAAAAVALGAVAGCGGDADTADGCGPILREALDSAYLVHLIDDDVPVEYASDPPTSGPHKPSPPATGVARQPLPRPVQVGILERGDVLLQYLPELSARDQSSLEAMAASDIVVAPNPDLPSTIVATAWRSKRLCGSLVVGDLNEFVAKRSGQGP